jgi:hypothetical protein
MAEIGIEVASNNIEIESHKTAIELIKGDYQEWENQINSLKNEMLGLKDEMAGFSLESKKNQLEIMEIRQQADRQGRELNDEEKARIAEIGEANDELAIMREKASIRQIELQAEIKKQEEEKNKTITEAATKEITAIQALETANASLKTEQTALQLSTQENALASSLVSAQLGTQKEVVSGLTESMKTQVTGTCWLCVILVLNLWKDSQQNWKIRKVL